MKIIETGIVIKDLKDAPVDACIGFQGSSHSVTGPRGREGWVLDGYLVLQVCLKDDDQDNLDLPCAGGFPCIWKGVQRRIQPPLLQQKGAPIYRQLSLFTKEVEK